jgi:hypothetical protein
MDFTGDAERLGPTAEIGRCENCHHTGGGTRSRDVDPTDYRMRPWAAQEDRFESARDPEI